MPTFDNLVGGILPDQPDWNLPDPAWSDARNVRFRDGAVEKMRGHEAVFGELSATAIWAAPINDGSNYYWAYGSLDALYATNGTDHAKISSATHTATADLGWNGGAYNGFLVANCGAGAPQTWVPGITNKVEPLANWPAGMACKVLRPFKRFLVAMRITESSIYNPRLIRWSSSAQPGALPDSWDYTDPSNDSGLADLGQTGDLLVDCLPLRDVNIIYKEQHTWLMEYVGGSDVFGFRQIFSNAGMLTESCAAAFGPNHLVLTDSDVILHDGNQARSVASDRIRSWLFQRINTNRYKRTFVVADHRNREVWICFPESGYDYPNLAAIWNWASDTWTVRELGQQMAWGASGIVSGNPTSFSGDSGTFDGVPGVFDEETYNPQQLRILLLDSADTHAYQADTGEDLGGITPTCYALRESVNFGRDVRRIWRVDRIAPKVLGTPGDSLDFYLGTRDSFDADVAWTGPYPFTIGVDHEIHPRVDGRIFDLRVQYSGTNTWRLFGYDVDSRPVGYR